MSRWQEQQAREEAILDEERAGGLWLGTGLGGSIEVSHTLGPEALVVISITNNAGPRIEVPIGWPASVEQLIASLGYHLKCSQQLHEQRASSARGKG
jgi:hypothetical protein